MVRNRIKVMRAEFGINAKTLVEVMPDGVEKVAMSFIESGRVLPTRNGMEAMCKLFDCLPTDLYAAEDLNLVSAYAKEEAEMPGPVKAKALSAKEYSAAETISHKGEGEYHEGMEQVRVWMKVEEKAALVKAIDALGYKSIAEWLRELYRETLGKYIALKLEDKKLHEFIPPTTENQASIS